MRQSTRREPAGVTMIEVIVSTLLVATILFVSISASGGLLRNQAQDSFTNKGEWLANVYLDEITSLAFRDPDAGSQLGPDAGEMTNLRSTLDDVDDYHAIVISPPTDRDGEVFPEFSDWSVSAQIAPASPTADSYVTNNDFNSPLRRIEVTCTAPNGSQYRAVGLVANVGMSNDGVQPHQRFKQVLLMGDETESLRILQPLRNHPPAIGGTP